MISKLQELLPKAEHSIQADIVDDVQYEENANIEDFGGAEGEDGTWVDEDEEDGQPQCAQQ